MPADFSFITSNNSDIEYQHCELVIFEQPLHAATLQTFPTQSTHNLAGENCIYLTICSAVDLDE